jgi:hyaluronan synthase
MMPFFILISFAMAATKVYALLTIRTQKWLTRDVEVSAKSKSVVRVDEGAEDATAQDNSDAQQNSNASAPGSINGAAASADDPARSVSAGRSGK